MFAAAWVTSKEYGTRRERLIEKSTKFVSLQAYQLAQDISADLAHLRGMTTFLCGSERVRSILKSVEKQADSRQSAEEGADINRYLARAVFLLGADAVWVINAGGQCVATSSSDLSEGLAGRDFSSRAFFRKVRQGLDGEQFEGGQPPQTPGFYFSAAVMEGGIFLGAIVVKAETRSLSPWVNKANALVSDSNGIVLLARNRAWEMNALPGARVARLSEEERMDYYQRRDFPLLEITDAPEGFPWMVTVSGTNALFVTVSLAVPNSNLSVTVFEDISVLSSIWEDCLVMFLLGGPGGSMLLLLVGGLGIYGRKLVVARSEALQASIAKGQFLATMSHEIRTPLNGVVGFSELLMETRLDDEQRDFAGTIRKSAEALLRIVNDVLNFSKLESGVFELEQAEIFVPALLEDCLDVIRAEARRKGISAHLKVASAAAIWLIGDSGRLKQVVSNLLGNAVKFTECGRIELLAGAVPGTDSATVMLELRIVDTGIGVKREQLGKIFLPFTQADASTTRRFGGTGLGLAITKNLVQIMGGTISATSEVGQGTEFTVRIPFKVPVGPGEFHGASVPVPSLSKLIGQGRVASLSARFPLKILVAEDQAVSMKLIVRVLQKLGYEPDSVENGQEVLEAFRRKYYDLVLMDIQMPKMDGYAATRMLRASLPSDRQPWIVALTANALDTEEQICLDSGMDSVLRKPLRTDQLVGLLKSVPVSVPQSTPLCHERLGLAG